MSFPPVRLNKYLAECGVASRRKADALIEEGLVRVNGKPVFELGRKIDPLKDRVELKGKTVKPHPNKVYIMLHKPSGVLSTLEDPLGRPTILDLISSPVRIFPVGRLDWDTEGLLLLTNDGEFSNKVLHPREQISKTYLAKVNGHPTDEHFKKLIRGVSIEGGKVRALFIERVKSKSSQYDWIRIVIDEGKYHQVRRMFEKIGFDVIKLKRVAIGNLQMGSLPRGQFTLLTPAQINKIFQTRAKIGIAKPKTHPPRGMGQRKSR